MTPAALCSCTALSVWLYGVLEVTNMYKSVVRHLQNTSKRGIMV